MMEDAAKQMGGDFSKMWLDPRVEFHKPFIQ